MRIAVVYDCLYPFSKGGGERMYRSFAEEFAAAGHRVSYLTRRQWDGDPPDEQGLRVVAVSEASELYDETGTRRPGPAIGFAAGVFRHLLRNRRAYDAVLVSATPATNVPAVRAALAGTDVVIAVDWLEVWRSEQWHRYSGPLAGRMASAIQRMAIRLSPIATCHSRLNARRLTELKLRGAPVVSPGLIDDVRTIEAELAPDGPPHVVYIGRHIPDKRVETLPAAIAYARAAIPELRATIFGEGQTRESVLAEIDRLGLGGVIAAPGFVSREELDGALRGAACLVNPSAREGYGLVVVESCAAGTPVVLVDGEDNASVELIEEGVNGTVARSTSPEDLGGAIVGVVRAGANLRKTTAEWFTAAVRTKTTRASAQAILARLECRKGRFRGT